MDKYSKTKKALHNISQKKFLYSVVVLLVILSGFLLFNQIAYLNTIYDEKPSKDMHNNV